MHYYFRLSPSRYEFDGDSKTIIGVNKRSAEDYDVIFYMDNKKKIKTIYTADEILEEVLNGFWILA